jgi:hypothetical protein
MVRLVITHPKPFYCVAVADFRQAIDELKTEIPGMSDGEIVVGLARIVAFIDGHSAIRSFNEPDSIRLYPLRLYMFNDSLHVIGPQAPYGETIGGQVIGIGKLTAEEALDTVSSYVPNDNPMTIQNELPTWILRPEVLLALVFIDLIDASEFQIEAQDGSQSTFNPSPIPWDGYRAWSGGSAIDLPETTGGAFSESDPVLAGADGVKWARPEEPIILSDDSGYFPHTPAALRIGDTK